MTGDLLAEPATTTTLGRPAQAGLDMPGRLTMPIKALSSTL